MRLWSQDTVDDAGGIVVVLGAVGGVNLIVDGRVGVHKSHVFVHAASLNVTFMALLELIKLGEISAEQEESFADIWIYPTRTAVS